MARDRCRISLSTRCSSASTGWIPTGCSTRFGAGDVLGQPGHHLHRVRPVLPVPAGRHPAVRASGCSSPARRSTSSRGPPVVELPVALVLFTRGGFLGNVTGYEIGRALGPAALRARRPDPQEEVLRPDPGVLRQARQQGAGDRPVRALRAHLHHRGRRASPGWSGAASSPGALVGAVLWVAAASRCSATSSARRSRALGDNIDKVDPRRSSPFSVIPSPASGGGTGAPTPPGRGPRPRGRRPRPRHPGRARRPDGPAQPVTRRPARALVSTERTSSPTSASGFSSRGAAVDRAHDDLDHGAGRAQRPGGVADGAAGGDDVLDERHPPAGDVAGPRPACRCRTPSPACARTAPADRCGRSAPSRSGRRRARGRRAARCPRAPARPSARPPGAAVPGRTRRGTCRSTPSRPGRSGA